MLQDYGIAPQNRQLWYEIICENADSLLSQKIETDYLKKLGLTQKTIDKKDPQFWSNQVNISEINSTFEPVILANFHDNNSKIMDFSIFGPVPFLKIRFYDWKRMQIESKWSSLIA